MNCNLNSSKKILYRFEKKRYNVDRYFGKNGENLSKIRKSYMHQTKGMKGDKSIWRCKIR